MLNARCPNCTSPIHFRHAASLSTVCEACESVVVRTDTNLEVHGRVSMFDRELSPLQVGVTGRYHDRSFTIVGGLRKERDRVRWNEWFLAFEDGSSGWLGEGNGQLHLFEPKQASLPDLAGLIPGQGTTIDGVQWVVAERASFRVTQATGELPFVPNPDERVPYADLRDEDIGRLGTLDGTGGTLEFWVGERVHVEELQTEGLRPIAGWSDPDLLSFAGPEITGTRAAQCPCCGGNLDIRNPGATVRIVCSYCESELGVDELGGSASRVEITRKESNTWEPTLPLGTSGTLDGLRWDIIGAMERGVTWEGMTFSWTEYLLYNPYRGTRWLVEDETGHWNLVDLVDEFPVYNRGERVQWYGRTYRRFQSGSPTVYRVLGEFTWEVHKGDTAASVDFVAPPNMLSMERSEREITWSFATWVDPDDIATAFEVGPLPRPSGVFPNQPNPWKSSWQYLKAVVSGGGMLLVMVLLFVVAHLTAAQQTLLDMRVPASDSIEKVVFVSQPFEMPSALRTRTQVVVDSPWSRYDARPGVALIGLEGSNQVSEPHLDSGSGQSFSGRTSPLMPGTYVARLAIDNSVTPSLARSSGKEWRVRVIRDVPYTLPVFLLLLLAAVGPVLLLLQIAGFEQRRWMNAD